MINWILLAACSPAPSSSQSVAPSPFLSHFPSPSPPAGPLASRRGDRIISEAFARFLPPSASSSSFLRGEESLIIVTGHGASSLTYSVALRLSRSLPSDSYLRPLFSSRFLSLSRGARLSSSIPHCLSERAAHFTIHFVHLPFKE